ncbi:hypothetical protein MRX96_007223 [Rhipicephalus microplus]
MLVSVVVTDDLSVSVYFKCAPLVSDDVRIPDEVHDVRVLDNLLDSVERYCEKKARQQEDKILTLGWITHASTEGHICSSFDLSHGNHRMDSAVKMNQNSCCFTEPPSLEPPVLPADFHVTFRGASSTENLISSPAWSCSSGGQGYDYLGCLLLPCWHVRTGPRWHFTGLACVCIFFADAEQANLDAHLAARGIDDYA